MGRWPANPPALSHFVGAPDKIQNMKYTGLWNTDSEVLAAWTDAAAELLRQQWQGEEDRAAATDPMDQLTKLRLLQEGESVRAAVGSLEHVRQRCSSSSARLTVRALGSGCCG
jgi:hypothetical protein